MDGKPPARKLQSIRHSGRVGDNDIQPSSRNSSRYATRPAGYLLPPSISHPDSTPSMTHPNLCPQYQHHGQYDSINLTARQTLPVMPWINHSSKRDQAGSNNEASRSSHLRGVNYSARYGRNVEDSTRVDIRERSRDQTREAPSGHGSQREVRQSIERGEKVTRSASKSKGVLKANSTSKQDAKSRIIQPRSKEDGESEACFSCREDDSDDGGIGLK